MADQDIYAERDRLLAERNKAEDELQRLTDAVCYYRALAIRLGADPVSMLNAHDKTLAETKLCDEEGRKMLDTERRETQ